jgi:hypothetical protein
MGVERASVAKITGPAPTGWYPQKRYFDALDRGRKRPIVWISGSPGSGKTALVSNYVSAKKFPCILFLLHLGSAARKAAPRVRKALPLLTPEYLSGPVGGEFDAEDGERSGEHPKEGGEKQGEDAYRIAGREVVAESVSIPVK